MDALAFLKTDRCLSLSLAPQIEKIATNTQWINNFIEIMIWQKKKKRMF